MLLSVMNIYTRTGDKGETGYIGGRISKSSRMVSVLGELDELNSSLGLAVSGFSRFDPLSVQLLSKRLVSVQGDLLEIGGSVAQPEIELERSQKFIELLSKEIPVLEGEIDDYQERLPKLTSFILPGGGYCGSALHLARSICRRTERILARYLEDQELPKDYRERLAIAQAYLNRLADWLFMAARYVNQQQAKEESVWKSRL